ncbi:hypothetical protein [Cellulosilyticum sp. I15G10I2]|uniref:hypothetical protein n=1 Tax=Cellulosilyticum sp. I15G10I2 TaxID=1892843 RepID=UPI00149589F8|nr:hypothetical protein [Cellulosilyticum sp. I15G10I2]
MNYAEVKNLVCDEFMLLYKHSIVNNLMKTEEGMKLLKRATGKKEPDMERLKQIFGKGV